MLLVPSAYSKLLVKPVGDPVPLLFGPFDASSVANSYDEWKAVFAVGYGG